MPLRTPTPITAEWMAYMSIRVGIRPMGRTLALAAEPCNWFSNFEADAVGSVPAGWEETDPTFRVRDDQAAVGSHSVRMDGSDGTCRGKREIICEPTQARLQWRWRIDAVPGTDKVARTFSYGDGGQFMYIWWRNQASDFRYWDGAYHDIPNSPPANPHQWYTFDARMDAETDKWKVIIDGNDSGWLSATNPSTWLSYFLFANLWAGPNQPKYIWVDEVRFTIGLP